MNQGVCLERLRYNAIPWRTRASSQAFNSVANPRYVQIIFISFLCHIVLCYSLFTYASHWRNYSVNICLNWSELDSFISLTRNVETAVADKYTSLI